MSKRVLIIDDEENIRQMTRLTLETAGYEVGEAESGMEAFAILGATLRGMPCFWTRRCRAWSGRMCSGASR